MKDIRGDIFILAYRFMDDGKPYLDKQLKWRKNDIESNLCSILSLLNTNDEVLIIDVEDYYKVMTDTTIKDWQEQHLLLRSYSIELTKGVNA